MKRYAFNEITVMQFIFIQFGMQIGFGLLSLPQELAIQGGTDSWMSILIVWIVSIASNLMMIQVMKRCPDGVLFDLLKQYTGKWIARAGALVFTVWFLGYGYLGFIRTVLYTKIWLLPQTPPPVIMLLLLLPIYLIARNGLRVLGRYVEFVLVMSFWIPIIYLLPLKDSHLLNLLPLVKEGWEPIARSARVAILSFTGFETTFILYPFLQHKQKAVLAVITSNTLTMLSLLLITLVCFLYFGPDEIVLFNEPVVNVLKTIEFRFIERIEVVFIAFYLFVFSLSWISSMYMMVFSTSWIAGKADHRPHLRVLCFLLAIGTFLFMPTFNQSNRMEKYLGQFALLIDYAIPVCLLVYLWIHQKLGWRKRPL
ncbi:GerAB/ArcD/ProY family transporter [Paenibacillus sp. y28]|uniref:GerAB/ArcD/ProY family transporter n=1 Tax=Paenibacillus sp. y28 TaxID=3129110 RepID=UPI00301952BD